MCTHCGQSWPQQVAHVHIRCTEVRHHTNFGQVPCADTQGVSALVVIEGVHVMFAHYTIHTVTHLRHVLSMYSVLQHVQEIWTELSTNAWPDTRLFMEAVIDHVI